MSIALVLAWSACQTRESGATPVGAPRWGELFGAAGADALAGDGFTEHAGALRPNAVGAPTLDLRLSTQRVGELHLSLPGGRTVLVREEGAQTPAALVGKGAAWSTRRGWSGFGVRGGVLEEWVEVVDAGEGPVAVWTVQGALLEAAGDAVLVREPDGAPRFLVRAPRAVGPGGVEHQAWLRVRGTALELYTSARGQVLVDPAWTNVTPMPTLASARAWHTASLTPDGRLLVAGGQAGVTVLSSAEVYDPVLGVWSTVAPMSTPRTRAAAVTLRNGKVLVVGGHDGTGYLAGCELFDPASQGFTPTGALSLPRADATLTLLPNGKVLLAGGLGSAGASTRAELYDPAVGTWSVTGALGTARSSHAAALLVDGRVLVTGGLSASSAALGSSELYEPSAGTFSAGPPLAQARSRHTATLVPDGTVVLVGGEQAAGTVLPTTELLPPGASGFSLGCVNASVSGHQAPLLPDGRVFTLNPMSNGVDTSSPAWALDFVGCRLSSGSSRLDATTNAWRGFTVTVMPSGLPLLVGGVTSAGVTRATVQQLDVRARTGTALADPPVPVDLVRSDVPTSFAELTALQDGRVLVTGAAQPTTATLFFDPKTDTWSAGPPLTVPRSTHAATALPNGKVLVSGASGAIDVFEVLDPATLQWTQVPLTDPSLSTMYKSAPAFTGSGQVMVPASNVMLSSFDVITGQLQQLPITNTWQSPIEQSTVMRELPSGALLSVGLNRTAELDVTTWTWRASVTSPALSFSSPVRGALPFPPDRMAMVREVLNLNVDTRVVTWLGGAWADLPGFVGMDSWNVSTGDLAPGGYPWAVSGAGFGDVDLGGQTYLWMYNTMSSTSAPTRGRTMLDGRLLGLVSQTMGFGPKALVVDRGVGLRSAWQPLISSLPATAAPGAALTASGARLAGVDGAQVPVVELSELNGHRQVMVRPTAWTSTSVSFAVPASLPKRAWWVRVIVNGVPSEARVLRVFSPATATPATASVAPRGSLTFGATGGNGATFGWSMKTNASGASISRTGGAYTAGTTGSVTDVVQVEDVFGAVSTATISVKPGVSVAPSTLGVPPLGSQAFAAAGGAGTPYTWVLATNASGGTLTSSGVYTAGSAPNVTDVLKATDALGNSATAQVTVGPGVAVVPGSQAVAPGVGRSLQAQGGTGGPYTWSFVTNASGGSLSAGGAYLAGAAAGVDVVRAADALGNQGTGSLTVVLSPPLAPLPVSAAVPPRGSVSFLVTGGSGTGYAWSLATNASGGAIDAATGAYQAGAQGGVSDVVRVTDEHGNTATVTVTVGPVVGLLPASAAVAPHAPVSFSAHGGSDAGFVFSLPTNGSGGTLSAAGAYLAGGAPNSTDVVQVTDSLGNTAQATVSVGPGVSITPATVTVYAGRNQAFAAQGGADGGFAWSLSTNGSSGSVGAGSGVYVAGATAPSSDVVRVVDPFGNAATATVTVLPGVTVVPTSTNVSPGAMKAFTASGGSDFGFTWALVTNASGGSIGATSGVYRAGSTGSVVDVVKVTDSDGNTATATVRVGPSLELTPATATVAPRGTQAFLATGGSGTGYAYALSPNASGGTLDAVTGQYRAGALGGVTDVVRVTDSLGNVATASVQVGPALSLTPSSPTVPPRGSQHFSTQGGAGTGVTFTLATNASGATLNAATGDYVAGSTGGVVDTLKAVDALGNEATTTVSVSAGVSVTPANAAVPPRGGQAFTAQGGAGTGFTWALVANASQGAVDPATGVYTAGAVGGVQDQLRVTDALGNTATVTVDVGPALAITPAAPSVAPRGAVALVATGGSGQGLAWAFVDNRSQGTLEPSTGRYVAGSTGSVTDVVKATDSLGNAATVSVQVTAGLTVTPSQVTVDSGGTQAFSAQGGAGAGLTWTLATNASGGSIDQASGSYRAGAVFDVTDVVRVTDALGNQATAQVTVRQGLAVVPAVVSVAVNASQPFAAVGGTGTGYAWSLAVNASGGAIDAQGRYTAGATGSVTDVVEVRDSQGHTARATVTVLPPLVVTPAEATVAINTALAFSVSGGSGEGYVWSLAENQSGGSVDAESGLYEAGRSSGVTDVVEVKDSVGNTKRAAVTVRAASTVRSGCGCSGVDGGAVLPALVGLVLGLLRRRR